MRYAIPCVVTVTVALATSSAPAGDQVQQPNSERPLTQSTTSLTTGVPATLVAHRRYYRPKKYSQRTHYNNYGNNYSQRPRYPNYPHYGPSHYGYGRYSGSFYYGFGPYNSVPYRYYGH